MCSHVITRGQSFLGIGTSKGLHVPVTLGKNELNPAQHHGIATSCTSTCPNTHNRPRYMNSCMVLQPWCMCRMPEHDYSSSCAQRAVCLLRNAGCKAREGGVRAISLDFGVHLGNYLALGIKISQTSRHAREAPGSPAVHGVPKIRINRTVVSGICHKTQPFSFHKK